MGDAHIVIPAPHLPPAVQGHLMLDCSGFEGRSRIVRQSFAAPVHISKPWMDRSRAIVQMVTPTAGLLQGDAVDIRVQVSQQGALVLTSPSALRLHTMHPGGRATITQTLCIDSGSFLEVLPHLLIPQAGSSLKQSTRITASADSNVIYWELLAPGRVAFGEQLQFQQLRLALDLEHGRRPVGRERYCMTPRHWPRWQHEAVPYIGTCFVLATGLDDGLLAALREIHSNELWIGVSRLEAQAGFVIRMLAVDSIALWKGVDAARALLYTHLRNEAAPDRV